MLYHAGVLVFVYRIWLSMSSLLDSPTSVTTPIMRVLRSRNTARYQVRTEKVVTTLQG